MNQAGAVNPVLDAVVRVLSAAVDAPSAFACLAGPGASTLLVARLEDRSRQVEFREKSIAELFRVAPERVLSHRRRVFFSHELWPEAEWSQTHYAHTFSVADGLAFSLVVFLEGGAGVRGVAGVERRLGDAPFCTADADAIDGLVPLLRCATCSAPAPLHVEPKRPASDRASPPLSARELQVADLLVAGYNYLNIAALSGLSPHTVRTYIRRLHTKLGVFNRADLVRAFNAYRASPETAYTG